MVNWKAQCHKPIPTTSFSGMLWGIPEWYMYFWGDSHMIEQESWLEQRTHIVSVRPWLFNIDRPAKRCRARSVSLGRGSCTSHDVLRSCFFEYFNGLIAYFGTYKQWQWREQGRYTCVSYYTFLHAWIFEYVCLHTTYTCVCLNAIHEKKYVLASYVCTQSRKHIQVLFTNEYTCTV